MPDEMPSRGMNDEVGDFSQSAAEGMVSRSMNESPSSMQSETPSATMGEMPKPDMGAEAASSAPAEQDITASKAAAAGSADTEVDVELAVYLREQEKAKQGGTTSSLQGMPGRGMTE